MNVNNTSEPKYLEMLPKEAAPHLSKDILLEIFSHLSPQELGKMSLVNKQWRALASDARLWKAIDLKTVFSSLEIFDESDWIKYVDLASFGLTVEDVSPLDKRAAIPILKRFLSLPIEEDAGATLLTIPKGLTFNKLVKIAGSPKKGNITPFRFIWSRMLAEIGDIPVDKTYRIAITNNVFKESRDKSYSHQQALVHELGCEMPKAIEAFTLLTITFMRSGKRLYNDDPRTYTRCIEHMAVYPLVMGGFSPDGISVYYSSFDYDSYGVGGVLRKF